ncbi:MAG: hypothetical protein P4N24_18975 [Acidobacteriota bacterium]|nr:hypothetical protein [Acidobacteriota bacterium]
MSFILVPNHGEDIQVNAWTWRPTLELLRAENLVSSENYERLGANGCGGHVDAELARRIAAVIERKLAAMQPGQRILADLTVSSSPKKNVTITPVTKLEEIDAIDFYSTSYEWLVRFQEFCKESGGFKVV